MSLQVWLPLNGNLNNQGLNDLKTASVQNGVSIDNNGKIGKCYTNSGNNANIPTAVNLTLSQFTICAWVKYNSSSSAWQRAFGLVGNTSNDRIGFCTEHSNGTSLGFHFTRDQNGTNTTVFDVYSSKISVGQWVHYVMMYDGSKYYIYENGMLVSTGNVNILNATITIKELRLFGGISSYSSKCSLNDIRIYDHCLSQKEVKEISKGLALHYRLAGAGGENLLKNSGKYTASNKVTMTTASRDGVSCPGVYYNNFNTTKQYTLTVECDGTLNTGHGTLRTPDDRYWTIWIYYHDTPFTDTDYNRYQNPICYNSSSTGFKKISDTKYSWTFTPSKANGSIRLNTYSDGTTEITVKFWNIKIEEGSVSTPWCPNSADALYTTLGYNDVTEYDCSGYGNNGEVNGTLGTSGDSIRYNVCYKFEKLGYIKNPSFNVNTKQFTTSMWVKQNNATSQHFLFGTFSSWTGNGIGYYRNTNQAGYNCIFRSDAESSYISCGTGTVDINGWHMITHTYDGTTVKCYVDGKLVKTVTYGKNGNIINPVFMIGNSMYNNTPTGENEEAYVSDVRFYTTALSNSDILELYQTSASIDNNGNLYCYELKEM